MVIADALIHINVGELNITSGHIAAFAVPISAGITAAARLVLAYLRERDAREAAIRQQVFDLAIAQTKMGEKAVASVTSLAAEKAK